MFLAVGLTPVAPPARPAHAACGFVLGFAALRDLVGAETVGECVENERFNPLTGNAEQRTTGGLLVWRQADNWTAFTDGHWTWLNGPEGLAVRLNTERFTWEAAETGAVGPAAEPAPPAGPAPRAHDWRAPGFAAAVGGRLYDPYCVPLHSAGINVPNLLYREGLEATLEWMRRHRLRWLRVFATGHGLAPERAPPDAATAVAALRRLLAGVEAFNARHDPAEAIYVLVALTDYYPPGVPGDRFAYDHPVYRGSPVLPAPWFRAGAPRFDFVQEHGFGTVSGLPNYEVHYRPWVRQVVPSAAGSPALLGWQIGNELKARHSPRNGITPSQAYDWYLDFTRDVVDVIREYDRNHLIFMGAQYLAELVDWEYRPKDDPVEDLLPEYHRLVRRALEACGRFCWNVWGLTSYDFSLYALDDAASFAQAGVASAMTEYGFTRGTAAEMQQRFGGDRPAAVRDGLARPWRALDGTLHARHWGLADLVERGPVAGVAAWGAPAPGPEAGFDVDVQRGITGAPDEAALWAAWAGAAAHLEAANRAAGPAPACLELRSIP